MYRLLIVDDEDKIRELIKKYAEFEGYSVDEAKNGIEALKKVHKTEYDLIVMDIMMPLLDGFTASREIRKSFDVPIIMLSARGEEYDKINGFQTGIDDYIVKPFSPRELMLRIDAVLKRYHRSHVPQKDELFVIEGLKVDFKARIIYIDENPINVSPKEYELLCYMIKNANIALFREKIISEVWGYDFYGDDRTLDTHIKLLRKSLGDYSKYIITLRGVGYRFDTK